MNKAVSPYLHFYDNCSEAMEYYHKVFGGDLELMKVGESPAKDQFPLEVQEQVLHATLRNGDFVVMASDMCGMGEIKLGNAVELSLECGTEDEITTLYQQLSEGGQVVSKLEKQFWGSLFAMVTDRFGVRWMLSLPLE